MAVDLKISTTAVTGWKRGARPQSAQVKKIAEYFKVSTDELTREAPDGAPVADSQDGRADLMGIIKSQQEAIRNLSESVRNLSGGCAGKGHL
jgi:hypothetical protein